MTPQKYAVHTELAKRAEVYFNEKELFTKSIDRAMPIYDEQTWY